MRSGINPATQSGIPKDKEPITPKSRAGSVSKKGGIIRKSYNLVDQSSSHALNPDKSNEGEETHKRAAPIHFRKGGQRGRFVSQSKSRTRGPGAAAKQQVYDEESKDNCSRANDYQSFASHAQIVDYAKKN